MTTHRPSRINPDTLPVLVLAVVLTAGLAAVSFLLSFAGLVGVSSWAHVPPRLIWAVPVMLDSAIVVYTLAILVKRARHERAAGAWWTLSLWTTVSVAANAAHAAGVPDSWQRAVGTVVAALAPIAVLLATHTIADLIVARTDAADTASEAAASAGTDGTADTTTDDERTDTPSGRPTATATTADADTASDSVSASPVRTSAPATVRRHPGPKPRTGGRAADHGEDIVRLAADGLSVRKIAEQVGVGKSAVAEFLRSQTAIPA